MKWIKRIFITIVALIAVFLILGLLLPKEYTVTESVTIKRPKQVVFDYMRILKNQENYSVWVMQDPNLHPTITGVDGTVGATQSWNSKDDNVGEGSQTISNIVEGERIDVDLHFIRPFKGDNKATSTFKSINENETILTDEFHGDANYPMNVMAILVGKKMLSSSMRQNLENVKKILEKQ